MRINQAGHQGAVAKVDHLRALGMTVGSPNFFDLVTTDQNFAGSDDAAVLNIEQPRGVQDNRMWSLRGLRPGRSATYQEKCEKKSRMSHTGRRYYTMARTVERDFRIGINPDLRPRTLPLGPEAIHVRVHCV